MNAEEITIRIGYDDGGNIHWADMPDDKEALIKKALAFRYNEKQQVKREAMMKAGTCRNCKHRFNGSMFSSTEDWRCGINKVRKRFYKCVRLNETCELFERKEDKQ